MAEEQVELEETPIGRRCYVGNLAWRTSWQDLKDAFRECGTVVYANVMQDHSGTVLDNCSFLRDYMLCSRVTCVIGACRSLQGMGHCGVRDRRRGDASLLEMAYACTPSLVV